MGRTAAAANSATPAVEQPQIDVALSCRLLQIPLRLVNLPGTGQHAAVLVGIGIAEHDLLAAPPGIEERPVISGAPQLAADGRPIAQIRDGLKQRHRHQPRIATAFIGRYPHPRPHRQAQPAPHIFDTTRTADHIAADGLRRIELLQFRHALQGVHDRDRPSPIDNAWFQLPFSPLVQLCVLADIDNMQMKTEG